MGAAEEARAAVEQVERAAQPEPQATQAARQGVRAATALLNPPAAKAVRLAIPLLNLPAARGKIASIRQGRELGRGARPGALVRALKSNRTASPAKIGRELQGEGRARGLCRRPKTMPAAWGLSPNAPTQLVPALNVAAIAQALPTPHQGRRLARSRPMKITRPRRMTA